MSAHPTADLAAFHAALRSVVTSDHLLVDGDLIAGHVVDWTGRWQGRASAVVRPGTVDEVRQVVEVCREFRMPIVPQGGNTGMVGGSIPHRGEVVVSLRRLDWLGPVDVRAREVTVGAGVTLGRLQEHVGRVGLAYGVDLASRDSATVGGTIATNAGGINVVAHGDTRRQVLGLQVVFADGSVAARLDGVVKESTGPDPLALMVGSEGTLGVITAARLRLLPRATGERFVTLVPVERPSDGLAHLVPGVRALEFLDRACLDLVITHHGLPRPIDSDAPFFVLIDSARPPELALDSPAVVDERLWAYREHITETLNRRGVPCKLDVSVPLDRVDDLADRLHTLDLRGEVFVFGHLAEGNFHVNVLGAPDPEPVVDAVLGAVTDLGGAVASEHGIGVAKASWWRATSDPALVAVARRLKQTFDPDTLFNPDVFWGGSD